MNIKNPLKLLILPVSILLTGSSFSQNIELKLIKQYLNNFSPDSALIALQKTDISYLDNTNLAFFHYYKGEAHLMIDQHNIAFEEFTTAEKYFAKNNDISNIAEINFKIGQLLEEQKNNSVDSKPFFDKYILYAKSKNDPRKLDSAYTRTGITYLKNDHGNLAIKYFDKAITEAKKSLDTLRIASIQFNKGVTYTTVLKNHDSALEIYKKTLPIFIKYNKKNFVSYNYNNTAQAYKSLGKYDNAIKYYKKADSISLDENKAKTKVIFYENISDLHKKNQDYKNAFIYLEKLNQLKDSINDTRQNIEISKIKEQYDNEKLRADNLEIEAKRVKNKNFLIGSLGLLLFISITAFLINKNTKRKQHIAEQERELEIQKTEKLLKEQELTSIDAMIAGQEKERQRLANDLHDNLGSTLATVKLHFQHLKNNKGNPEIKNITELYDKTDNLLEEAYQKVRTIAHEKNSGVMANQGLLPAIKKLAKKVSNSNQLLVEVQDYGLEKRLDNTLEITIFRMIQELLTNSIKHSHATEVHISLTNHDSLLNIIIEDNGKGFDAKVLPEKDGMGLATIEKRIEHLEGTFEIDSTIGKGTNIIINIPI